MEFYMSKILKGALCDIYPEKLVKKVKMNLKKLKKKKNWTQFDRQLNSA